MKVALYLRVSTKDQDVHMQETDLKEFCRLKKYEIIKIYTDHAQSGAKDSRPALNQLMKDIKKRKFNAVIVWKFDRFSRSLVHLVKSLEQLQHYNVGFISYQEAIDLTTSTGKLMFSLIGAFAEFERNIIRERVTAGIKAYRTKHKKWGRTKMRNDYLIRRLRDQGNSLRQIAKILKISLGSVQRGLMSTNDV